MNDHELTLYAALASGREIYWEDGVFILADAVGQECSAWHPLHDDGDALRLAMRMLISIRIHPCEVSVSSIELALKGIFIKEENILQPMDQAVRRAIVRAAAKTYLSEKGLKHDHA